jgi:hypothetical protein|tara:strand:- start:143 stop:541 length:399 start_codon:yes stop_codon:yes gene_type:complete
MDPISIIIGLVVLAGIITVIVKGREDKEASTVTTPVKKAKAPVKEAKKDAIEPASNASPRVQALKSKDAVKASAAPVAQKVPTKTALLKLTKSAIEESARAFDIELDKRATKEKMVDTYLKTARAQAKAQRK